MRGKEGRGLGQHDVNPEFDGQNSRGAKMRIPTTVSCPHSVANQAPSLVAVQRALDAARSQRPSASGLGDRTEEPGLLSGDQRRLVRSKYVRYGGTLLAQNARESFRTRCLLVRTWVLARAGYVLQRVGEESAKQDDG